MCICRLTPLCVLLLSACVVDFPERYLWEAAAPAPDLAGRDHQADAAAVDDGPTTVDGRPDLPAVPDDGPRPPDLPAVLDGPGPPDLPAQPDTPLPVDGPIVVGGTIRCGSGSCSLATQLCCHNETGSGGTCVAISGACGQIDMTCDDPSDCGGGTNVCCARLDPGGQLLSVGCVATASLCVPSGSKGTVEYLCDPASSTPCPGGSAATCVFNAGRNWYRCQ